jgi:molybdopterin-guanine dinucleotide biosynthesis protein A
MGRDKASLPLTVAGQRLTLGEHAGRRLERVSSRVVVAGRGRRDLGPWPSLDDGPGAGPVAGILGAAAACPGADLLVLACDLPRVPVGLLAALAELPGGDFRWPRWRRGVEPLCALYRAPALRALAARVAAGHLALQGLERETELEAAFLEGEALGAHGDPVDLFANLNTPEDLATLEG